MPPLATYDHDVRAIVVTVHDGLVAGTIAFPDDAHLVDVDADGRVLSLEILTPTELKLPEIAAHFGFESELPGIAAAIADACAPTTTASK